ncbi:T9SS type A sorting domain-containing protein [bacterium]|nr:T9SS type A sorting domain-containing protein [bacterium]
MKKMYRILGLGLMPLFLFSQIVINNFDGAIAEGTINWTQIERDPSYQELSDDSTDAHEGAAALKEYCSIGSLNTWGSFAHTGYKVSDDAVMDWSGSESFSVWIKVQMAPALPDAFVFRMHIGDQAEPGGPVEEYLYENATIVDEEGDWKELVIPIIERETNGSVVPNDEGFVLFPTSWGGSSYNNNILDLDKIYQYSFALVTTGIEADEIELSFDNFTRSGTPDAVKSRPAELDRFELCGNYPNPFNPATRIGFRIPSAEHVRLDIVNLMGQQVDRLLDGMMPAGSHEIDFHAGSLPPGVYFYRLNAGNFTDTQKMILLP